MIRFLDGPASLAHADALLLRRAPLYLRVVRSPSGSWDALDQLHDEPRDDERVWAYRREGPAGMLHLDCRSRRSSGWFASATYRLCEMQPDESTLRDTGLWRAWCAAQVASSPES